MRFAFLVHPLNAEMTALWTLAGNAGLRSSWGTDLLGVCGQIHRAFEASRAEQTADAGPGPRVVDEIARLDSRLGGCAEGRLYEISLRPKDILSEPQRALDQMQQAVAMATEWGAEIVGLGSMTGIIGGRGTYLAEHSSIAITTGNSLTVYATLQNVYCVVEELGIDLRQETVAVVGIPGSIASAVASLISPQCGELLLIGRQASSPALKLAADLDAELLLDVDEALSRSRLVISATSSGDCIDQERLRSGSIVVDVGVPSDVRSPEALRDDVLILTGGFVGLPRSMPLNSGFLWFQHGMIPSCLGETIVLALAQRAECFSLGRKLDLDAIQEIGAMAREQGFDFSQLYSFGGILEASQLVRFQKLCARNGSARISQSPSSPKALAEQAPTLYARHINPVWMSLTESSDFVKTFIRGEDTYLIDRDGNRYLDIVSGFGAMNLGHNHPAVVDAVTSALQHQAPGFAQSAVNPYAAALAKELVLLTPDGLEMVCFTNSGTEAIEASLKLARKSTGRTAFLSCDDGFHGKSMGALSLAGNREYRQPFEPLIPGSESVPFGDYAALERALASRRFAAFVVEPIQGEGGVNVPPVGYLREAQALCRAAGTLLVVDEIQTGLGRTGKLFAVLQEGVAPDILTVAKSLGGGLMPIGAMLCRRDLWMQAYGTAQTFALHTSTFAGGSLACAAGLASLETIRNERLAENAALRGRELKDTMTAMCREYDCLRAVRGRGLLLGLEFQPLPERLKRHWKQIDRSGLRAVMIPGLERFLDSYHAMHAMQSLLHVHRIYSQTARSHLLVLRVQPPLTVTQQQVDTFLRALDATCREIDDSTHLIEAVISKSSIGDMPVERQQDAETQSALQVPR